MRILAVADVECPALWDYFVRGRLDEYDLILSCGDLKAQYLTFLVTMSHAQSRVEVWTREDLVKKVWQGSGRKC